MGHATAGFGRDAGGEVRGVVAAARRAAASAASWCGGDRVGSWRGHGGGGRGWGVSTDGDPGGRGGEGGRRQPGGRGPGPEARWWSQAADRDRPRNRGRVGCAG